MGGILTILNLKQGNAIRIVKTFRDDDGREFAEGTLLHFKKRDFPPYHGGHTVYFEEATMYLCDNNETGAIVDNPNEMFFQPVAAV